MKTNETKIKNGNKQIITILYPKIHNKDKYQLSFIIETKGTKIIINKLGLDMDIIDFKDLNKNVLEDKRKVKSTYLWDN